MTYRSKVLPSSLGTQLTWPMICSIIFKLRELPYSWEGKHHDHKYHKHLSCSWNVACSLRRRTNLTSSDHPQERHTTNYITFIDFLDVSVSMRNQSHARLPLRMLGWLCFLAWLSERFGRWTWFLTIPRYDLAAWKDSRSLPMCWAFLSLPIC